MSRVTLYHYPLSFSSQIVRLALAEKGVAWDGKIVDIGPAHENYKPAYMRLNPGGVVPTLVHDGTPITDCIRIIDHIDEHFPGPHLKPRDPAGLELMNEWIDVQQSVPERALTYAVMRGFSGRTLRRDLPRRRALLERLRRRNPELDSLYTAKIQDVEEWAAFVADDDQVADLKEQIADMLDAFNDYVSGREWLAGDTYSLADVVWTVLLARLELLGLDALWDDGKHEALAAYYARVKARPSFRAAGVQRRSRPLVVMRSLFKAHGGALLGAVLVLAVLAWVVTVTWPKPAH